MNKLSLLASSTLLACSGLAFAEGFYFQGGGGAGFVSGAINHAGANFDGGMLNPVVDSTSATVGAWIVGAGYMFSNYFGVEANYLGYGQNSASKTFDFNPNNINTEMTTNVWQINLLGVARTPFEVGLGFFVKAKAGLGYTYQTQDITATPFSSPVVEYVNNQADKKYTPVLGIGIERDMTDLLSLSLEYIAAVNNEVENSMVFLALKFNPFDVVSSFAY